MAPRNTKQGASAKARRSSKSGGPRAAASSRTRSSSAGSKRPSTASKSRSSATAKSTRSGHKSAPVRSSKGRPQSSRAWSGPRWLVPAAIATAIAVFAWGYYPVAAVQYRESRERSRLAAELASVQARNDRLRAQVDRLKTPAGVEDYARSQLGMVKKGENVVVVVDGDETSEGSAAATPDIDSALTPDETAGPWTAFLDLVFGIE